MTVLSLTVRGLEVCYLRLASLLIVGMKVPLYACILLGRDLMLMVPLIVSPVVVLLMG